MLTPDVELVYESGEFIVLESGPELLVMLNVLVNAPPIVS